MAELSFESATNAEDFTFRYSVLQQYSPRELSNWLRDYYTQIKGHIVSRFQYLAERYPEILIDSFRYPYLAEACAAARANDYSDTNIQPFVHFIALFGLGRKGGSCHEVLFGESKPVIIRQRTLSVLDMFGKASPELQSRVILELGATPSNVNNPVYTSYYRYADLAKEVGRPVNQWLCEYYMNAELFSPLIKFQEAVMRPQDQIRSFQSVVVGASCLWWMSLLVCPALDISADYLFAEDYSHMAVRPDRALTEMESIFLSTYLSSARHGQRNCRYLFAFEQMNSM